MKVWIFHLIPFHSAYALFSVINVASSKSLGLTLPPWEYSDITFSLGSLMTENCSWPFTLPPFVFLFFFPNRVSAATSTMEKAEELLVKEKQKSEILR